MKINKGTMISALKESNTLSLPVGGVQITHDLKLSSLIQKLLTLIHIRNVPRTSAGQLRDIQ